jgi:hypothetical protein
MKFIKEKCGVSHHNGRKIGKRGRKISAGGQMTG